MQLSLESLFACHEIDVCVEKESSSAISATSTQQSSNIVQIQPKDERKTTEAAKLSTEFVAEVIICVITVIFNCDHLH